MLRDDDEYEEDLQFKRDLLIVVAPALVSIVPELIKIVVELLRPKEDDEDDEDETEGKEKPKDGNHKKDVQATFRSYVRKRKREQS